MHIDAIARFHDAFCGVELWVDNLEAYERVLPLKDEFEGRWLQEPDTQVIWDDHDEEKKSRRIIARITVNFDKDDWSTIYQWIVDWMFRIRELALVANGML